MTRPRHCKQRRASDCLRLRAPLTTLFLLAAALLFDTAGVLRWGLLASVLHECGHLGVWVLLTGTPPRLVVSPAGIRLSMRGASLRQNAVRWLAAAGPLTNLGLCAGSVAIMRWCGYTYAGYWFASANFLVGAFNLLPLPGLDGARVLGPG